LSTPPLPDSRWALFLDLDGTLLDFAPTPDAVVVPDDLVATLSNLAGKLERALAIVSGRRLDDIDRFMAPLVLPCGAEHGAIMRYTAGEAGQDTLPPTPDDWLARAGEAVTALPGTLLEHKTHGLVLHYRRAPKAEEALKRIAESFVAESRGVFELLTSNMAWEIRPRGISKGRVVERFMEHPPFEGRVPVFIGDDITDRDGCAAARKLGGHGLMVPEVFPAGPPAVRAWLAGLTTQL
jgi:trehalose 6-phosphate phosphatase